MKRSLAVIMALVLLLGMVSVATAAKAPSTKPSVKKAAPKKAAAVIAPNWTLARTLTDHTSIVRSVAFSPDGTILASGSVDETIKLWDPYTGTCLKTLTAPERVFSLAFSPDGKTLAAVGGDSSVRIWDVATGTCLKTFAGHSGYINAVAYAPDGKTLASGSDDETVKIWDLGSGACQKTLPLYTGNPSQRRSGYMPYACRTLAFSPDGKTLVGGCNDSFAKVWNVASGVCLRTFPAEDWEQSCESVAFSPDGKILARSTYGIIKLWNPANGALKWKSGVNGSGREADGCYSLAFSPDGKTLATGNNGVMRFWDVNTGARLNMYACGNDVYSVAFAPNGKMVATGSYNHEIKIFTNGTVTPTKPANPIQVKSSSPPCALVPFTKAGIPFTMLIPKGWRGFGKSSVSTGEFYTSGSQDMNQGKPERANVARRTIQSLTINFLNASSLDDALEQAKKWNMPASIKVEAATIMGQPGYHIRGITGNYSAYGYTYISETDDNWVTMVNTGSHAGKALLIEMGRSTDDPLGLEPVQQKMIDSFKMVE